METTHVMILEKAVEKVRKLLRLADNAAATEHEAANAMAAAKAIALAHDLDLASVDLREENGSSNLFDVVKDDTHKLGVAFWRPFHPYICLVLKKVFSVRVIPSVYSHGSRRKVSRLYFVGEATDVAIAKEIFSWLEQQYPKTYHEMLRTTGMPKNAATMRGFYRGLTNGLLEANKREEDKLSVTQKKQWGLMLVRKQDIVERKMREFFPDLKARHSRPVLESAAAQALGGEVGRRLNLNQMNNRHERPGIR